MDFLCDGFEYFRNVTFNCDLIFCLSNKNIGSAFSKVMISRGRSFTSHVSENSSLY